MNTNSAMKSPPLAIEFSRSSLKLLADHRGAEFPLDRQTDGRLTQACRERLVPALQQFLKAAGWPANSPAWCAIDARGVSLRCLRLPAVGGEGLHQVVQLQIESEFPLPPEELAWGFRSLGEPQPEADGSSKQAVLVAAVKKEVVEDYARLLAAAGIVPTFTLAALARTALVRPGSELSTTLELSPALCELAVVGPQASACVRVLPGLAGDPDAAGAEVQCLVKTIRNLGLLPKLYVFGDSRAGQVLASRLGPEVVCELLATSSGPGRSAATLGLRELAAGPVKEFLILGVKPAAPPKNLAPPELMAWGLRAALLLLAVLLFPALEALLLTAPLAAKVTSFQDRARQAEMTVDRDLDFLQYVKQSQPPCLESIYVISQAAPSGMHLESLTMNRRGELALRASLRNGDQVAEFRSKLIGSGFFASVTVEEQTPSPDHQKVNIRLTAQWKALSILQTLAVGPTLQNSGEATNHPAKTDSGKALPGPVASPGVTSTNPVSPGASTPAAAALGGTH